MANNAEVFSLYDKETADIDDYDIDDIDKQIKRYGWKQMTMANNAVKVFSPHDNRRPPSLHCNLQSPYNIAPRNIQNIKVSKY